MSSDGGDKTCTARRGVRASAAARQRGADRNLAVCLDLATLHLHTCTEPRGSLAVHRRDSAPRRASCRAQPPTPTRFHARSARAGLRDAALPAPPVASPPVPAPVDMELTWWRVQAIALLPLPVVLIAVLSAPAPREARRRVLWFTEQVLGWEVRRPFQVKHVALLITGISVLVCLPQVVQAQQALAAAYKRPGPGPDANALVLLLGNKFRHERNFWLSFYAFTAWVVLHIVHKVNKDKHELRGRLLALQGRGAEAASEVAFIGSQAELEMNRLGTEAAAAGAGKGPLGEALAKLTGEPAAADERPAGAAKKAA